MKAKKKEAGKKKRKSFTAERADRRVALRARYVLWPIRLPITATRKICKGAAHLWTTRASLIKACNHRGQTLPKEVPVQKMKISTIH
jgi:hypothetical protein